MTAPTELSIAVIGGGISGLTTAYYLEQELMSSDANFSISVFERADQVGGKLKTKQTNGSTVEIGPDSISTRRSAVIELIRDLQMEDQIILPKLRSFSFLIDGKIRMIPLELLSPFPRNVLGLAKLDVLPFSSKIRAALGALIGMIMGDSCFNFGQHTSLSQFLRRKWGHSLSKLILEPLFGGLYGGDPERLSSSILTSEKVTETNLPPYIAFREGIGALPLRIKASLRKTEIFCNSNISIERHGSGYDIIDSDGERKRFKICILATDSKSASQLISPISQELAYCLGQIECAPASIATLYYDGLESLPVNPGSGVIIPECESKIIRGITITSKKWEARSPANGTLIRVFGRQGLLDNLPPEEAINMCKEEVARVLGISNSLSWGEMNRWQEASPIYSLTHNHLITKVKRLATSLTNIYLLGTYFDGPGIGDCIHKAKELALSISSRQLNSELSQAKNCKEEDLECVTKLIRGERS